MAGRKNDQERRDINDMKMEVNKDNLNVRLKKFERDHPDSNFLKLYGWGGSVAEPSSWSASFTLGIPKTTMVAESW